MTSLFLQTLKNLRTSNKIILSHLFSQVGRMKAWIPNRPMIRMKIMEVESVYVNCSQCCFFQKFRLLFPHTGCKWFHNSPLTIFCNIKSWNLIGWFLLAFIPCFTFWLVRNQVILDSGIDAQPLSYCHLTSPFKPYQLTLEEHRCSVLMSF